MKSYKILLSIVGAVFTLAPVVSAQLKPSPEISSPVISNATATSPDVLRVDWFGPNPTVALPISDYPDDLIRIINPGTAGASTTNPATTTVGNLCAMIYVVDPSEELNECCGCLVTPDQVIVLGVRNNLTANPATGAPIISGTIKILSSSPTNSANNACDPGVPVPTPTLREWITHHELAYFGPNPTLTLTATESEFSGAPLSTGELTFLSQTCNNFEHELSGHGICNCTAPHP